MSIKSDLKNKIKNSPRLYMVLKALRGDDKVLLDLVSVYNQNTKPIMVVEQKGTRAKSIDYYRISFGEENQSYVGFFALVRDTMRLLAFADMLALQPVVHWGKKTLYYDKNKDTETQNVFEYYYKPLGKAHSEWETSEFFYTSASPRDILCLQQSSIKQYGYTQTDAEVEEYARLYGKYFELNESTAKYLAEQISSIIDPDWKVLAVHVRGTDFKKQMHSHPQFRGFGVFVDEVKQREKNYDKIFLATDDEEALELFKQEFGDKLLYYSDCTRSTGSVGAHIARNNSPYAIGLDVLRDVYTMAACTSLVCGLSQVSYAVRYIKKSTQTDFEEIGMVKMEINQNSNKPNLAVQQELDEARKNK